MLTEGPPIVTGALEPAPAPDEERESPEAAKAPAAAPAPMSAIQIHFLLPE
jgi:hypothetical protein